jgi:Asp-tRNA(Asn)/Glu-tRNA(Gln) amidotransferase A subunit family amidase
VLLGAAYLLERLTLVSWLIWQNAGFASLRNIRRHLDDHEARFDPAVIPRGEELGPSQLKSAESANAGTSSEQVDEADGTSRPYSVAHYRRLYLSGELSPLDVTNAILPLIRRDASPPSEHSIAWTEVKADLILQAAAASAQRYKEKRSLGPLDGVPVGIKDEVNMEGYRTSLGSPQDYSGLEAHGELFEAWVVTKMKEAGAVILGKMTMHEYGMDTSGNNITFGTPRNPYNRSYYTGGSSSGPAYGVATGLMPVALGNDGGGSIRIPSSFCSVYGLKTTHGRVSYYPGQNHISTCGAMGPIASDMQSLFALYDVLNQPDPHSLFPPTTPGTKQLVANHSGSDSGGSGRPKILGVPEAWLQQATPAVQQICRDMIDWLVRHKQYTVVPISIPFLAEGQIAHAMTLLTDASTMLHDARLTPLSPGTRVMMAMGHVTPANDYLLAQKLRRVLMQHLAHLFETHPGMMMVTPTSACAGWPIRNEVAEMRHGISDGDTTMETMRYVWMANFCGLPALTVPAGYVVPEGQPGAGEVAVRDTVGKVPVGMMVMGEWASEDALMQFGLDVEGFDLHGPCRPPNWVDVIQLAREYKERKGTVEEN